MPKMVIDDKNGLHPVINVFGSSFFKCTSTLVQGDL